MKPFTVVLAAACLAGAWQLSAPSRSRCRMPAVRTSRPPTKAGKKIADGAKYFVFGYMNRNWEEEIDVPVGPDNGFNIGGADQGQPTHFLPRRNRFIFRVPVPSGFTEKDELIWTSDHEGQDREGVREAARRLPDRRRRRGVGDRRARRRHEQPGDSRANKPPTVEVAGPEDADREGGAAVTIVTTVHRRRHPEAAAARAWREPPSSTRLAPRRDTAAAANDPQNPVRSTARRSRRHASPSARTSACTCRGSSIAARRGDVHPEQIMAWEDTRAGANSPWAPVWVAPEMPADGKVTVQATFAEPGTYVLRAAQTTAA